MLLEAGKHVLCEKPLALNADQAREMVEMARGRGLFLMEAIWSRFLPTYRHLVEVVGGGRIGEPIFVEADFGFRRPLDRDDRLFRLDLGGGGLLDLGIYPLQLCTLVLGPVEHVAAEGVLGDTGVDEQVAAVLRHGNGTLGVIKAALRVGMTCTARISGTSGVIEIPALMHCPNSLKVMSPSGIEEFDGSYEGNGLRFEIEEVQRCLAEGKTESDTMSLDETLALAGTLDAIRAQIGLVYPGEERELPQQAIEDLAGILHDQGVGVRGATGRHRPKSDRGTSGWPVGRRPRGYRWPGSPGHVRVRPGPGRRSLRRRGEWSGRVLPEDGPGSGPSGPRSSPGSGSPGPPVRHASPRSG